MSEAKMRYEVSGFGKADFRRFCIECEEKKYIEFWTETKISFYTSMFYVHGTVKKLTIIKNYLDKYLME